jgi:hypothetical protein
MLSGHNSVPGILTTKKTKRQGASTLKTLIESNQMTIQDFDAISELTTFVVKKNGTYAADEGANDDIVMTLLLFAWLTTQQIFKDLLDTDMRKQLFAKYEQELEEMMPPLPVHIVADPTDPTYRMRDMIRQDGMLWEVVKTEQDIAEDMDFYSGYPTKSGFRY